MSIPFSVAIPIGAAWTMDVQSAITAARLTYDPKLGVSAAQSRVHLYGPSDVRVRTTGRLFNDALVLTAGANLPTGRTDLSSNQLTVLRGIAAPALGLGMPPVGAGASGTLGAVVARQLLGWAIALGGSYEMRGSYQPIAALTAGAPSADFQPGNVVRGSLGLDRVIGGHRLSATGSVDVYANDELRDPTKPGARPLATVRLGPIVTSDLQLQLAVPRVKEFILWGTHRFRTRYQRDGDYVAGTSGFYADGGVRTSIPMTASTDLLLTGDGKWHSGLAINQGIATSGVISGGGTIGLAQRLGALSLQPFVRGQGGQLRPRVAGAAPRVAFASLSAGLVLVTRF
jgi:hypothetical protein